MPDPEVKIKFTSEYDDAAAKEALLDFENLPIQAGGLIEVINQNYAALEQMAEALRQTTDGLREHVAALDPAAEGYDRAVANCRSYIARQVALSQQCEAVRNSIMEQAGTVLDLSKALEKGRMSEAQFEEELEGLSQEGIKAEQTIERLAARLDAMNASQKAANLNTKAPEAASSAVHNPLQIPGCTLHVSNNARRKSSTFIRITLGAISSTRTSCVRCNLAKSSATYDFDTSYCCANVDNAAHS